jgi:hypothetical protein
MTWEEVAQKMSMAAGTLWYSEAGAAHALEDGCSAAKAVKWLT